MTVTDGIWLPVGEDETVPVNGILVEGTTEADGVKLAVGSAFPSPLSVDVGSDDGSSMDGTIEGGSDSSITDGIWLPVGRAVVGSTDGIPVVGTCDVDGVKLVVGSDKDNVEGDEDGLFDASITDGIWLPVGIAAAGSMDGIPAEGATEADGVKLVVGSAFPSPLSVDVGSNDGSMDGTIEGGSDASNADGIWLPVGRAVVESIDGIPAVGTCDVDGNTLPVGVSLVRSRVGTELGSSDAKPTLGDDDDDGATISTVGTLDGDDERLLVGVVDGSDATIVVGTCDTDGPKLVVGVVLGEPDNGLPVGTVEDVGWMLVVGDIALIEDGPDDGVSEAVASVSEGPEDGMDETDDGGAVVATA